MSKKTTLLFLFISGIIYSQDIIKFTNGSDLNVKILSNNSETISFEYSKTGYPYFIVKSEIEEIHFQNGTVEKIDHPQISLEDIKSKVIALIDENALAEKSGRKFHASFEDNYLRMIVLSDKDNSQLNKGLLFDLSKVYQFDELSLRYNNRAYINIWTDRIRWPERKGKDRMDKIKLIIRINSYEKAALLLSSFKQLHKSLIKK